MVYKVRMLAPTLRSRLSIIYAIVAVTGIQDKSTEHEIAEKLALTTPTPVDLGLKEDHRYI